MPPLFASQDSTVVKALRPLVAVTATRTKSKRAFNMLLLHPIQIQTNAIANDASQSLYQTDSCEHFYHRTPAPTAEELQFFGLKVADKAQSQDQLCAVCFGPFQDPVITRCKHTFCFGCIYEWLGGSTSCPKCSGDLYQPRKLREQPSREIHPAERSGPVEDTHWKLPSPSATSVKATFKAHIRKPSTDQKLLIKKTRSSGHLQIPQLSHQHSHSDRAWSATQQHRNLSNLRKGHTRGGRHSSLPSYMKHQPSPQNLPYTYAEPVIVHSPQDDAENIPPDPIDLDASMIELYSTCTKYLERAQQAAAEQSVHVVSVDSEEILADMWLVNKASGQDSSMSIRCKAIAKCVWREWEEYLKRMEGSLIMGQELWWGLHRNFERTVVEYGWVEDWTDLPGDFVDLLERTMAVAGQR